MTTAPTTRPEHSADTQVKATGNLAGLSFEGYDALSLRNKINTIIKGKVGNPGISLKLVVSPTASPTA